MCGISGFLNTLLQDRQGELHDTVLKMVNSLRHRGPDDVGAWVDASAGIALGHRRLAIVDLSPEGHQPMHSCCARYVITFNGEIYNFKALRRELEDLGYRFRGGSDTEVMLACISEWGLASSVARFNGMFAFALWDRRERRLHLVRDRLGEKPLYYGWAGKSFVFASELKALLRHPAVNAQLNRDALALFLRHNYIPAPYSIYAGFSKVLPGTILSIDPNKPRCPPDVTPYWSVRHSVERGMADLFAGSETEAVGQLDTLLREAVKLRMEADVPLGAFLSGGIDSSTIVALMQAQSAKPVQTFTIGFHEAEHNEAHHAKAVARHLGTAHTELYVTPVEAMALIPQLPSLYDEPFSDSSQIPTVLVSQLARRDVTVTLSGDGGDEIFGGYDRYLKGRKIWQSIGWMPPSMRALLSRGFRLLPAETWSRIFQSIAPMVPAEISQRNPGEKLHRLAEILEMEFQESFYLLMVSHWKECASVVLGSSEPATVLTDATKWLNDGDFAERMMYIDSLSYLPDDILVKVDRASMGVSLEARVPFLDHRVVEFAWQLPFSMKIHNGKGKKILQHVLHKYVPPGLMDRAKMGFGVPLTEWLRGPLREWADDLLDEKRLKDDAIFDPLPIRQKWDEHLSGQGNWQYYLWDVLIFQAWKQHTRM